MYRYVKITFERRLILCQGVDQGVFSKVEVAQEVGVLEDVLITRPHLGHTNVLVNQGW